VYFFRSYSSISSNVGVLKRHFQRYFIITPEGTSKLLKNLNLTKAIGPDKISPHFLKEVHDEISPMISDLFQSSVNTGTVPTDWREAIVTPVFKKGAKSKPENYRLISLTCILSKVLEPIRNKNCLWWPCLLTDRDKMSNLYWGHSIDASYQVSVHLAKRFQRKRF
jgi:hypothetical protein